MSSSSKKIQTANSPRNGIFSAVDEQSRQTPAIEFRDVKLQFDEQIVLDDISFKVVGANCCLF